MTVTQVVFEAQTSIGSFPGIAYRDLPEQSRKFLTHEGQALLKTLIERYEWYDGAMWRDPRDNSVLTPETLKQIADLDYYPTMITVRLLAWLINRRASWMFQRSPTLEVIPDAVDDEEKQPQPEYTPSAAQVAADKAAVQRGKLLQRVVKDNRLNERLLQGGRDYFIGGGVACKIHVDPLTGLKWIWRPRLEYWPIYDADDVDQLIEISFVAQIDGDETRVWRQRYWLNGYNEAKSAARTPGAAVPPVTCWVHEAFYYTAAAGAGKVGEMAEEIVPPTDTGLPFIPVEIFANTKLSGETEGRSLVDDLKDLNAGFNRVLSDAQDSLRFGQFPMLVMKDVDYPIDPKTGAVIEPTYAPGAEIRANSPLGGASGQREAKVESLEHKFSAKEMVMAQLGQLQDLMHMLAEVPQLSPERVAGIGKLSGFAIKLLYGALINATEEAHMVWEPRLERLLGKSLYMLGYYGGSLEHLYDAKLLKSVTSSLDELRRRLEDMVDVDPQIPLPENREELITLLTMERSAMLESIMGAMRRAGVENPEQKLREIIEEKEQLAELFGLEIDDDPPPGNRDRDDDPPPGDDE